MGTESKKPRGSLARASLARATLAAVLLASLTQCSSVEPEPTPSPSPSPTTAEPSLPPDAVDMTTLDGKLLMGYQGWFACPEDGSNLYNGYYHWIRDGYAQLDAASYRVDMWPDTSELTTDERCATALAYPDGSPAPVYSAANPQTALRHFEWMHDYGIDGVFLQRFSGQLDYPDFHAFIDRVMANVRTGAETTGRAWALMYDVTGAEDRGGDVVAQIEDDWTALVDDVGVTQSPAYLNDGGLPVVALWGLGFENRPGTPADALELLTYFGVFCE